MKPMTMIDSNNYCSDSIDFVVAVAVVVVVASLYDDVNSNGAGVVTATVVAVDKVLLYKMKL